MDGEISDLDAAALQRHLQRCVRCEALATELTRFTRALRVTRLSSPQD